jgi:hypothetical protein
LKDRKLKKKDLFFEIFANLTIDCKLFFQILVIPFIVLRVRCGEEIEERVHWASFTDKPSAVGI